MLRWFSIATLVLAACTNDSPEVVSLATGLFFPADIALDGERVYWVQYDGSVHSVGVDGGLAEELAPPLREHRPGTIPIQLSAYNIAAAGGRVYWSESASGRGRLWTLSGGEPELMVEEDDHIQGVEISGDRVLWFGEDCLRVMESDGRVETIADGLAHPRALVAGDVDVLWVEAGVEPGETASGRLARAPLAGGQIEVLADNLHDPLDLILVGDEIVWTDNGSCTRTGNLCNANNDAAVRRKDIDPDASMHEVVSGFGSIGGLAALAGPDGDSELYFAGDGRLWMSRAGIGQTRELAGGSFDQTLFPGAVTTDSSAVFWVNSGDNSGRNGSIVRADRR